MAKKTSRYTTKPRKRHTAKHTSKRDRSHARHKGLYRVICICSAKEFKHKKQELLANPLIQSVERVNPVYLTNSAKDRSLASHLQTAPITKHTSRLRKMGCILAHLHVLQKAVKKGYEHILVLEEDAELSNRLPKPPRVSCYMGGWIVPKNISETGKTSISLPSLSSGLQSINYDVFKIIMSHAYYLRATDAREILNTMEAIFKANKPLGKIRNYDVFLAEHQFMKHFYYPERFVQGKHVSTIDGKVNQNDLHTKYYGLKE